MVRIGIIGVGNMGYAHAKNIFAGAVQDMKLTALCDTDAKRRAFLKEQFDSVPVFENHTQLIESGFADAVIVATPHCFHADICMAALGGGLHVLSEKPVDITVSKARRLNALAEEKGLVFGVMFNQRTNPLFAKAREIVRSGQLGELKRFVWIITNWYRHQSYYDSGSWRATWKGEGGGVLLNQAPHNLDIWQWVFGMPESITAFCDVAKYHNIEVEDDATIYAKYANGATGVFITTTGEYPGTNRLEISGDRGKLVLEDSKLRWWRLDRAEREFCFETGDNQKPEVSFTEIPQTEKETAHLGILRNFAAAILSGEKLLTPGVEGINELMISNAAYLSSWTGRSVSLPFDETEFDELLKERMQTSDFKEADGDNREKHSDYKKRWQVNW